MKVKIGPYLNWIGPYQIGNLLKYFGVSQDTCHIYGEKLSNIPYLMNICEWIDERRKRKIKIKIDSYDIWNLDDTLSLIVVPLLRELKRLQHGAPSVDDEDVPDELKRNLSDSNLEVDSNWFKRWDYIIDEMIFAFEKVIEDDVYDIDVEERINRGLRMFGKYYRGLWD